MKSNLEVMADLALERADPTAKIIALLEQIEENTRPKV